MGIVVSITVSEQQRSILERWRKNKAGTSAQLIERCSIILLGVPQASPSVAPKGILKYDNYCDVLKCRTTYIMSSWTSVPGA